MTPNATVKPVPEQTFVQRVEYCRAFLAAHDLLTEKESWHVTRRHQKWMQQFTDSTRNKAARMAEK